MRKLIVGLMLLFFSVNVFAWDVSENYYVKDSRGTSHRLATPPPRKPIVPQMPEKPLTKLEF
ncbi:hypothetical protein [Candidatus Endomicrobiellum trichonymphae]|uniref:hypothetical protein n=1 Tax=Endomicrobium trichonymphae TaxID=1408204 RepID=UPI000BBB3211|nr:hypothetical protein [Candidatus Endomicrobium trichonymphae]